MIINTQNRNDKEIEMHSGAKTDMQGSFQSNQKENQLKKHFK